MKKGRKAYKLIHIIFAFVLRVLNKKSELESAGDVVNGFALAFRGVKVPSGPTVTRRIRSKLVVETFQALIRITSLAARESNDRRVYADGAEFNTPNRDPDDADFPQNRNETEIKSNPKRTPKIPIAETIRQKSPSKVSNFLRATMTVKLHPLIHHGTGLIIAAIVSTGKSNDTNYAIPLLDMARRDHTVKEFIADKGYSSNKNYEYCERNHILPIIPPKENYIADEKGTSLARFTALWRAKDSELPEKYGIRNNAEGTHSAVKRIQYEDLRSRSFLAQQAELLSMVLLRNIRRSVYQYVVEGVDIPWFDQRCRALLDPVREKLKKLPNADKSPRFHDEPDQAA